MRRVSVAVAAMACAGTMMLAAQQPQQTDSQRAGYDTTSMPSANNPSTNPGTSSSQAGQNNPWSTGRNQTLGARGQHRVRIHFSGDNADLSDSAKSMLDQRVEAMRSSQAPIVITSHGGKAAARAQNPSDSTLATQRADAVMSYLVSKGIPSQRIQVASSTTTSRKMQSQGQGQKFEVQIVADNATRVSP